MSTYRKRLVIQNPDQVVLLDVPFKTGQEVEITLRSTDPVLEQNRNLRMLFKKTQQLPQIQTMTEDDIASEIKAYRTGL